jgi:hypothetical protein
VHGHSFKNGIKFRQKGVDFLIFFHFFIHILEFGPGSFKPRPVLFFPTARPHGNDSAVIVGTLTTSGQGKMLWADSYPYGAAESGAAKSKLRVCFFSDDRTDCPSWIGPFFCCRDLYKKKKKIWVPSTR